MLTERPFILVTVTDPLTPHDREAMVRIHQVALTLDRLMEHTSVCSKGHHPDPRHGDSDIWQGIVCRWSAGCKKYRVPDFVCEGATDVPRIDAKTRPEALGSDVVGMGKATSGSLTDKLTREHRLTLDEAHMILNTKKENPLEQILSVSDRPSTLIFAFADAWGSHFTELRASIQTEFAPGNSHSCKTSSREAYSGEVSLTLPSIEGFPGERTYRGGTQTAGHIIGISTPTNTGIGTAKPIASHSLRSIDDHIYTISQL